MDKGKIISEFNLRNFGGRGWLHGSLSCPECDRRDKFGVMFTENSAVCHCFYCSLSWPLNKVLKLIDRSDLISYEKEYEPTHTLPSLQQETVLEQEKPVDLPIGFMRVYKNGYLQSRKFTEKQIDDYKVGMSSLDPRTEGKLIFQIFQHNKLAGWIARSTQSKEWHHENLRRHKEHGDPLVLRYRNSNNDFSKILGGIDEVTDNTETLILVEGLFDKVNVDRLLNLDSDESIKCCFTFGSDLSVSQADLIPNSIEQVILMYDKGAVEGMRMAGGRLMSKFNVRVAEIKDEEIDPGNMTKNYLSDLLLNLVDYIYFYTKLSF